PGHCCGGRIRTSGLRVMSPASYHCSTPRHTFYRDSLRSDEHGDPSHQSARSLDLRRIRVTRTRIPLHRDERLPRPHPPVLLRLLDAVVGPLLLRERRLELGVARLLTRDRCLRRIDVARERVLLDRDRRERPRQRESDREHTCRGKDTRSISRSAPPCVNAHAAIIEESRSERKRQCSDTTPGRRFVQSPNGSGGTAKPAATAAHRPRIPSRCSAARWSSTWLVNAATSTDRSGPRNTATSLREASSVPLLLGTSVPGARKRRSMVSSAHRSITARTASAVERSRHRPSTRIASNDASSRAVATFSSPRFAASKSYIRRRSAVLRHPHSASRSATRSTPTASMTRLVAVLSDRVIVSAARSRSERSATSRRSRSTPEPSTRSPKRIRRSRSIRPSAASA